MFRITNGFEKLSLADFRQKVDFILKCMVTGTTFTSLQTRVQNISALMVPYKDLDDAAVGGDSQMILRRNIAQANIIDQLHLLGNDVTSLAENNVEILAASGFSYTQPRKSTPDITKPDKLKLEAGLNKGEIVCTVSKQPGMIVVNFYYTTDPNASTDATGVQWNVLSSNRVKATLTGLESGVRYFIKAALVGVRGQEVFSDVYTYIPQ